MSSLAGDDLGDGDTFILGLVRQHRAFDDIADGIDAGHAGGVMRVHADATAIVGCNAKLGEAKPLGVRNAADRDQHHVAVEQFLHAATSLLDLHLATGGPGLDAQHLGAELEGDTLLFEDALKGLGDLCVHPRRDAIEHLDNRHLGAESPPHRAKLKPDIAGADHHHALRHLGQGQRAGR